MGIRENIHEPKENTRDPLKANIRHGIIFTFQQQSEIISNRFLFHNQNEQFRPQAIKDTLPYFLGAVKDDYVEKKAELNRLQRQYHKSKRNLVEYESLGGEGATRAKKIFSEAQDLGMYEANIRFRCLK